MRDKDQVRTSQTVPMVIFVLICAFTLLCASMFFSESRRYRYTRPGLPNVWYGERNNAFQLAGDGTGWGYIDDPTQKRFFRWSEFGGTIRIYNEPRAKSLFMKAHQFIDDLLGSNAFVPDAYVIQTLENDEMTLLDPKTGTILLFSTIKAPNR